MAARYFRLILRLYPRWMRARYGGEMLGVFLESLRAAPTGFARAELSARALLDGVRNGLGLRWEARRSRRGNERKEGGIVTGVAQDLRYALLGWRRRPGLSVLAVLTLAIGIGGNTLIYSVVDAVLLRPLPFHEPGRVGLLTRWIETDGEPFESGAFSEPAYLALEAANRTLDGVAAFNFVPTTAGGTDAPFQTTVMSATASLWSVLGVRPRIGRLFDATDDRPGATAVAVISERLWTTRFAEARATVGSGLVVGEREHEIIGVLPADFVFLNEDVDVWIPLAIDPGRWAASAAINNNRSIVARTGGGVSGDGAAELADLHEAAATSAPDALDDTHRLAFTPLRELQVRDLRGTLWMLFGAVFFVLLIACANLANLLLVQAEGRRGEFAVRAALGAGRSRLLRQLLTESLLLAGVGGVGGVLLAVVGLEAVRSLAPASIPRLDSAGISVGVLAFTSVLAAATGVLFGLAPALATLRSDLRDALAHAGRSGGGRHPTVRTLLVVSEVAITVVLMIGSGLLVATLLQLQRVDVGLDPSDRLMASVRLPGGAYPDAADVSALLDDVRGRIAMDPAVLDVAYGFFGPLQFQSNWFVEVEGRTDEPVRFADYNLVTPGYFSALGIPLIAGRDFEASDALAEAVPTIVSETMARRLFPDGPAVGRRLNIDSPPDRAWRTIVGVVGDVRTGSLARAPDMQMYFPPTPMPFATPAGGGTLIVRHAPGTETTPTTLRRAVASAEPRAALGPVRPVGLAVRGSEAERRFVMWLLTSFAGAALLLSLLGLYGVTAHAVALRRRELGLRLVLGATPDSLVQGVLRQGALMSGGGALLGLAGAAWLARLLERLLYGVRPLDPLVYALVAGILATFCLLTATVPALRIGRIDPTEALRSE